MKLIHLSSNQPSFKTVEFCNEGLTLIVGDGSKDIKSMGGSNGVGKTLALRLIHHCLGANLYKKLADTVPDWVFRLVIELDDGQHIIDRSGDSKIIQCDSNKVATNELRNWLENCGAFRIDPSIPGLGFRSLVKRFSRYELEDCIDPLSTKKETEYYSILRSLYLLGADCTLAVRKMQNRSALGIAKSSQTNWKHDEVLKSLFRGGAEPSVRAEWLNSEIPHLQEQLDNFQVSENYRDIERQSNQLTVSLREIEKNIAVLQFQIEGICKSLEEQPDISRDDLLQLYSGLQHVFKKEALEHFQNVEKFQTTLIKNRKARLSADMLRLETQSRDLLEAKKQATLNRDELLRSLHGKRALDDYANLAQRLASLKEEQQRLNEYLNLSGRLEIRLQDIKGRMLEESRLAAEYIQNNPLANANHCFKQFVKFLFPESPSGIVLKNNDGDNQLRYQLSVHIEGQSSDGINAARILCFDILLLLYGANHSMGFLWHDNRFFAHIDPRQRAAWFRMLLEVLPTTGKQYVASINTENFLTMKEYLSAEEWSMLQSRIRLRLRGDHPSNKLLGIQFDA